MSNPQDVGRKHESTSAPDLSLSPAKLKLLEVKARLAETDEEIAGTITHLQRLEMRRKSFLGDMNVLTSPILDLPPELTCEVFLRCLPHPHTRPNPRDAPFVLANVCTRWRAIALAFPALWSSICAAALLAPPRNVFLELLETQLIRSGDASLSVSLVPDATYHPPRLIATAAGPSVAPVHTPLFRTLRLSAPRWASLTIIRHLEDFPALLHRDDAWALPALTTLTLLLPSNGRHPTSIPPGLLADLTNAPLLRAVHLMGGFAPASLRLPWAQLTRVRCENVRPLEALQTLAACPVLEDAALSLWPEPIRIFRLPNNTPIARCACLEAFTLVGEVCTPLLDHLELPRVHTLTLSLGPDNPIPPLAALFTRQHPTLKCVELEVRGALPPADLMTCLEALSGVESLSLSVHTGLMNGPLVGALRFAGEGRLLPRVRKLEIRERVDRYNEPGVDEGRVVEMLEARWGAGADSLTNGTDTSGDLKSFTLVTTHVFWAGAMHPGFAALARAGMEIEVRSHGEGPFLAVYFSSKAYRRSAAYLEGKGKGRAV